MFYYVKEGKVTIGDSKSIAKSKRTFDICCHTLAKNGKLLSLLNLMSLYAGQPDAVEFFCAYLGSFYHKSSEELIKNPTLRILIEDENLQNLINEYCSINWGEVNKLYFVVTTKEVNEEPFFNGYGVSNDVTQGILWEVRQSAYPDCPASNAVIFYKKKDAQAWIDKGCPHEGSLLIGKSREQVEQNYLALQRSVDLGK